MKNTVTGLRLAALALLVIVTGCAHCTTYDTEEMYTLASALTKLTASVEATVYFKEAPAELKDMALIDFAIKHDPRLKEPFADYLLKAVAVNGHAVLLVCDRDGKVGMLEDGGCSKVPDRHWWREEPCHACEISGQICQSRYQQHGSVQFSKQCIYP